MHRCLCFWLKSSQIAILCLASTPCSSHSSISKLIFPTSLHEIRFKLWDFTFDFTICRSSMQTLHHQKFSPFLFYSFIHLQLEIIYHYSINTRIWSNASKFHTHFLNFWFVLCIWNFVSEAHMIPSRMLHIFSIVSNIW